MKPVLFGIVMTVLACAGLAWLWHSNQLADTVASLPVTVPAPDAYAPRTVHPVIRDLPPSAALPPATAPEPMPAAPVKTLVATPTTLNGSDTTTREAVRDLSDTVLQWLTPDEQLRKWVLLVDNIAMGKVPLKSRPLQLDVAPFKVSGTDSAPTLAPQNFARTTPLVDAFVAVDPALLVRYYRAWGPLLDEAYAELGQSGPFHNRLLEAIDRVLAVTPLQTDTIALKQPAVFYTYADPEREQASDLEKMLWRMGPRNTVRLQSHLREIKLALQQKPS